MTRAELAPYPIDIVVFYTQRYRHARHIEVSNTFIAEVQSAANDTWYKLGLYEKYGCDYFDQTFNTVEDDATYYQDMGYLGFVLQQDDLNRQRVEDRQ